jgi:hypothetical protein
MSMRPCALALAARVGPPRARRIETSDPAPPMMTIATPRNMVTAANALTAFFKGVDIAGVLIYLGIG